MNLDTGCTQIGREATSPPIHRDQRVRLLTARCHNAARAVIFKRSAEQADTIGKQGRSQSVASETLIGMSIKAEFHR